MACDDPCDLRYYAIWWSHVGIVSQWYCSVQSCSHNTYTPWWSQDFSRVHFDSINNRWQKQMAPTIHIPCTHVCVCMHVCVCVCRGVGHGTVTTVLTVQYHFLPQLPRESIKYTDLGSKFPNFSAHQPPPPPSSKLYFRWLTVPH